MTRQTIQREAIRRVFEEIQRPLGIEEILAHAQEHAPTVNIATVYRNVNRLLEEKWLVRLELPALGTFFERSGKGHHHHFHCRGCNQLYDLSGCGVKPSRHLPLGYVAERHELFLFGLCRNCSAKTSAKKSAR